MTRMTCRVGYLMLGGALAGCSWQATGMEHHLGPVLFRHSAASGGQGAVGEVVRLGLSAEGGATWGLAFGMSERVVVAPADVRCGEEKAALARSPHWSTPLSAGEDTSPEEWHLSLLYLRVEHMPNDLFVARTIYGLAAVAGDEASALTIGYARRTRFTPPKDAFSFLHFQTRQPLAARAKVWREMPEVGGLPGDLLQEVDP